MFTTAYIVNSTGNTVQNPVQGKDFGPYLFNWADATANPDDDYYVWEAARATSAAPVYFPIAQVGGGSANRSSTPSKWVVDGGTMSNNPAVWGFSEAFRLHLASSIEDIIVISLGTGVYSGGNGIGIHTNYGDLTPDNGNWSKMPWMVENMYDLQGYETDATLLNIILGAVPLVADCQLNALIKAGLQYYRLEPQIPQSLSAMDKIKTSNISALETAAANYISQGGNGYQTFNNIINLLKDQI
jgi:predicted acylesterase/phospholipase RssA